ncbi:hypothetical protein MXB_4633 [Myxobolus squamalis]|nr:hypothetical protein MXB_4633 [Myxobolus squamalis]
MANQECVKSIFDEFKQYTLNRVECNDICFQATKKHFNKPQSPGEKNLSFSDPQMTAHPPRNSFSHQTKKYRNPWGNLSYANLIAAAILSSQRKKMKLNEIYNWFVHNIPYFALREDDMKSRGWKNSIRHNLSLKKDFIRESGDKKAGYWYINQKAFLTRLKAENRQINDPGYNKDMEIFELYAIPQTAPLQTNVLKAMKIHFILSIKQLNFQIILITMGDLVVCKI